MVLGTGFGGTNFRPFADPPTACVSHGSAPQKKAECPGGETLKRLQQPGLELLGKDGPGRVWPTLGNITEAPDNPKSSGCLCLAALLPAYHWDVDFMGKTHLS